MQRSMAGPSSASTGFFQREPELPLGFAGYSSPSQNSGQNDDLLNHVLALYLPRPLPAKLDESIEQLATLCLAPETVRLMVDSEANHPTLHLLNNFGEANEVDPLRTSEGWRGLKAIQTRHGIVGHGYKAVQGVPAYNLRVYQFVLAYLWSPSCASVSCPAAMSDGAAILLARHLSKPQVSNHASQDETTLRKVLEQAYVRLTSLDPQEAWTSGQWMTERTGGSDVSKTETHARLITSDQQAHEIEHFGRRQEDATGVPLGPWIVDGFKWFSSATDADCVVLLAQTSIGLSAFYAPMRRMRSSQRGEQAVMNGVRISRLKNKLGTKGLPTAELEIRGMRAWLLGQEGQGVKEVSAILNATRLWTAVGAVGGWARALAISKAFAQVRTIRGGSLLANNTQHVRWLADETVKHHAYAHFAFFGVTLLGLSESGWEIVCNTATAPILPRDRLEASRLLRLLTPVMKARCSLSATLGIRECMESLGGVGYCENDGLLNVARAFRDSAVNSIWEGTTSILADDFVRALKGRESDAMFAALDNCILNSLGLVKMHNQAAAKQLEGEWVAVRAWLAAESPDLLVYHGRKVLMSTQALVCAVILHVAAIVTASPRVEAIAARWLTLNEWQTSLGQVHRQATYTEALARDRLIFVMAPSKDDSRKLREKL